MTPLTASRLIHPSPQNRQSKRALLFIFYPILGRKRFDEATFASPPDVLQPTVGAIRVRKGIGKSLYFVPFDLNARRELAPCDRTFYEEHAHCPMPASPWLRSWSYARSAVNISSLANGAIRRALAARNRQDQAYAGRPSRTARTPGRRKTATETGCDGGTDSRVEPQGPAASLPSGKC